MTPKDVISELKEFLESIEKFPNDDTFRCELDRAGVTAILAAIQTAENDALERAALIMESLWAENDKITKPPGWDTLCLRAQSEIRALKT